MVFRVFRIVLLGIVLVTSSWTCSFAQPVSGDELHIIVGEREISFDDDSGRPFIGKNGRVIVPVRVIAEQFEAKVSWIESIPPVVLITKDKLNVRLWVTENIGDTWLDTRVPGAPSSDPSTMKMSLDSDIEIINGRTYVPVRVVFESLGATISWEAETNTVRIL
ncbi:MAG: copper amine oxidase N-terminal domain-containing protein [Clostridiales Family XIII bacterium]|jgi:hypothetical protein|nr:copper amine oxidase N-terminal domain-containing protein [Clostridiales Family XIII bacterium]